MAAFDSKSSAFATECGLVEPDELVSGPVAPPSPVAVPDVQQAGSEQVNAILKHLKEDILPRARTTPFTGSVPLTNNGKLEIRTINSLEDLESLIRELEAGISSVMALPAVKAEPPKSADQADAAKKTSGGFFSKLKKFF